MEHLTSLPQMGRGIYLSYMGIETDLIFNRGVDLPGFATYPMLQTVEGRQTLIDYGQTHINLARDMGVGAILDSATWVANRDRGAEIGHTPQSLRNLNIKAIELIAGLRQENPDVATLLCAQMGPRGDSYAPSDLMTMIEAESYHAEQVEILSQTEADFICGVTICYPEEAIGIVRNAVKFGIPSAISFTVETDGCLPTGIPLGEAISKVDFETNGASAHFMINCAHPTHFNDVLTEEPWVQRLKGVIVNASKCSHAELDDAEILDDGNPAELGKLVGDLRRKVPHLQIFGGCCGTDMRHMRSISETIKVAGNQ